MPQFTYDDMRHKILKRERYKFALNYAAQFFPIFKENPLYFDENKGYKRFLRVTRFYLSLPRTSTPKNPFNGPATMMPKQVNFVKAKIITAAYETDDGGKSFITLNPPYNFMRSLLPCNPGEGSGVGRADLYTSTVETVEKKVSELKTASLLNADDVKNMAISSDDAKTKYNYHIFDLQPTDVFNTVPNIFSDQLARNEKPYADTCEITNNQKLAEQNAGVVYEFFPTPDPFDQPRKAFARPVISSKAKDTVFMNCSSVHYREDRKHDPQLLSEISLHDNRIFIALYENVRGPSPDIVVEADKSLYTSFNDVRDKQILGNTQMQHYADMDMKLYLDRYFLYDPYTGYLDKTSTYITGAEDENFGASTMLSSLKQYITQIQGYIEIEVILVDMSLKR